VLVEEGWLLFTISLLTKGHRHATSVADLLRLPLMLTYDVRLLKADLDSAVTNGVPVILRP
jgi:hypothetical protein